VHPKRSEAAHAREFRSHEIFCIRPLQRLVFAFSIAFLHAFRPLVRCRFEAWTGNASVPVQRDAMGIQCTSKCFFTVVGAEPAKAGRGKQKATRGVQRRKDERQKQNQKGEHTQATHAQGSPEREATQNRPNSPPRPSGQSRPLGQRNPACC
jgi:hypothetical protein